MIEKNEDLTGDSQLDLEQIKNSILSLPESRQSFYWDTLNTNMIITLPREVSALINYELVWNELVPIDDLAISAEDLRRLLPWVTKANQKSWDEMITNYHPYYVFITLKSHNENLLDERLKQIHEQFIGKIEQNLYEECIPGEVDRHKNLTILTNSMMNLCREIRFAANLNSYDSDRIDNDKYIEKLTEQLSHPLYKDLVLDRNIPEFKEHLIRLLHLEHSMSSIDIIEPTHKDLEQFICLLDEKSRQKYENEKASKTPYELYKELKEHLTTIREELITPLIIYQTEEKDLIIEFPKESWCKSFVSLLDSSEGFSSFPVNYYQGNLHNLCFKRKGDMPEIIIEFSTPLMANCFRRLLINYPEDAIAFVPDNNKAICLSNETIFSKNRFFKLPMPREIISTSVAEKADIERTLYLLISGFKDQTSLFTNFPMELLGVIGSLVIHGNSEPVGAICEQNEIFLPKV